MKHRLLFSCSAKNARSQDTKMMTLLLVLLATWEIAVAVPQISSYDKVANLDQGITVNQPLSTITCSDDTNKPTDTYIRSISPASPCGNCFEVLHCNPDECLQYRAGVGTLNYATAKSYVITVACYTNSTDPPATEVIQVYLKPNSPPYFQPDPDVKFRQISLNGNEPPGTLVYNVDADDEDQDTITYSMTVVPSTSASNYRIDPDTGQIFTTVDLRSECTNDVTFQVYIDDGVNKAGPLVIEAPKKNPNVAPVATNLDTVVMVPEDETGTAYTMNFKDGNAADKITYTYTANNPAGAAQFTMTGKTPYNIDIAGALDYENTALRQTDYVVTATDGFCTSPPYSLRVRVTDVNEPPTLTPNDAKISVCEGKGEFDPGYKVIDPDYPDTTTWRFSGTFTNPGQFSINPATGTIRTIVDFDVDGDKPSGITSPNTPNPVKFVVVVTDKGELKATATVTVTFTDCNDNAPIFDKKVAYEFVTTECITGGARVGTVTATDKDKTSPNKDVYYEGSGGSVVVGNGGEIIVVNPLPAGSVITFNAYAWDRGVNPGPLRSVNPAVVSVRFTVCPTPPPPTPAPTAAPTTAAPITLRASTTSTTTKKTTRTEDDPNLPWIVIAALLGAVFLALLSYLLWRYWSLCGQTCRNLSCGRSCSCKGRPSKPVVKERPKVEPRREPVKRRPPSRPPSETPSEEPKEKDPENPGFLFGFWKTNYTNEDLKKPTDPKSLPEPGDMNYHYPHTYDPVQPTNPAPSAPDVPAGTPKKRCVIQ